MECGSIVGNKSITPNPSKENVNLSSNLAVSLSANINLPITMIKGSNTSDSKEIFCLRSFIVNQKEQA